MAGLRSVLSGRSVAGQVFVLLLVMVLLLVVAAVVALVLQVQRDSTQEARNRSLAVAETFANAPGTIAALNSPTPPPCSSRAPRPPASGRTSTSSSS